MQWATGWPAKHVPPCWAGTPPTIKLEIPTWCRQPIPIEQPIFDSQSLFAALVQWDTLAITALTRHGAGEHPYAC